MVIFLKKIQKDIEVYTYSKIDSTNAEAIRKIDKVNLPSLFIAKKQTSGRGRLGRSFYSANGGLYMTLAINGEFENLTGLTIMVSVAVVEAIEKLTGIKVGIKWVNDIYLEDKKICGILCEKVFNKESGEIKAVIIGIGINLNIKKFPDEIKDIAGNLPCKHISKTRLAGEIVNQIFDLIEIEQNYIDRYREKSIMLGKTIYYNRNSVQNEATVLDIDDSGGLVVEDINGKVTTLTSGEISVRFK